MNIIETLEERFKKQKAELVAGGLEPEFQHGPAENDPRAAWFDLDSERRVGRLTVWDNGAAEITVGEIGSGDTVVSENREITTSLGLDDAVRALIAWVS